MFETRKNIPSEDEEQQYVFSIIMAVYNVGLFLQESIESLIAQDFGFERVQLILVDDGSTDGSPNICDRYAAKWPKNIKVVHKDNGGAASARNAGIDCAKGLYFGFVDADDKLSSNALSKVAAFFEKHGRETDLASIPMVFFDGRTGEHPLNNKYSQGTRVISLEDEWWYAQLSSSSCFFKSHLFAELRFEERITFGEDAHLVQKILLRKRTLGVISDATYYYRKRTAGDPSTIQRSLSNPDWYVPTLKYNYLDIFRYAQKHLGRVPTFLQVEVLYDLQWRLKQPEIFEGVLSPREEIEFRQLLRELLGQIDNDVILAHRQLSGPLKLHAIQLKYGGNLIVKQVGQGAVLQSCGKDVLDLSDLRGTFEFLKIEEDILTIEGSLPLFPFMRDSRFLVQVGENTSFSCRLKGRAPLLSLGTPIPAQHDFRVSIPLHCFSSRRYLRFFLLFEGAEIPLVHWGFGPFFPVTRKYKKCYYEKGRLLVTRKLKGLLVQNATCLQRYGRKLAFLLELWRAKDRRAILNRVLCAIMRGFKKRPLWLISDRTCKAGDNGEAFFRYMRIEHPEIDARFVIHGDSGDCSRMEKVGPVVKKGSYCHKLLLLLCDYTISSHADADIYNPFPGENAPYRDLLADRRFVFLQHGVTKDDLSSLLNKSGKNIHGFITAAKPEYQAILEGGYHYTEDEVWLTGFPRFDRLSRNGNASKRITVCPTWRKALMGQMDPETGTFPVLPEMRTSEYLLFFKSLFADERLLSSARRLGFQLAFFPHPNLQPHVALFELDPEVLLLGNNCEYRDVYANSSLLLTDYSSVVFDFAYLRQPVLYAQFDKDHFFDGSHSYTKGYFDYERDGFGEVEYDLDSTVARLIEYMENGCRMKPKYRERVDRFFAFNDQKNCQRVYEAILAHQTKGKTRTQENNLPNRVPGT